MRLMSCSFSSSMLVMSLRISVVLKPEFCSCDDCLCSSLNCSIRSSYCKEKRMCTGQLQLHFLPLSHILRNRTGHTGVQQTSTTICSRTSASASLMHWEEACVQVKNHLTPTLLPDYFSHIFYLCHTLGRTMHAGLPSSRSYSFTLNQFIINVQFCLSI